MRCDKKQINLGFRSKAVKFLDFISNANAVGVKKNELNREFGCFGFTKHHAVCSFDDFSLFFFQGNSFVEEKKCLRS